MGTREKRLLCRGPASRVEARSKAKGRDRQERRNFHQQRGKPVVEDLKNEMRPDAVSAARRGRVGRLIKNRPGKRH